jgi:hypothetical protein
VVHQHYYKIIGEGQQEGEMEAVDQELCKSSRKRRKQGKETLKEEKKKLEYMAQRR